MPRYTIIPHPLQPFVTYHFPETFEVPKIICSQSPETAPNLPVFAYCSEESKIFF